MNESFNKFMQSQCTDCAFEFIEHDEYCAECGLRFKSAYTAGMERAAAIAEDRYSSAPLVDEETCKEIAAAIRKGLWNE